MIRHLSGFAFLLLAHSANATTADVVETFASRADFNSGTAVWNQALGKIHPTLQVVNFTPAAAAQPFDVGDGSDGSFDLSTYASFSQAGDVSGNIIRLDTTVHPQLQVTKFYLAPGWTLQPSGANPLIIKSLSTVDIQGVIDCSGADGAAGSGASGGAGGTGRCGGFAGGAGAAANGSGVAGTNASGAVTGGQGGNFLGGSYVGGGGGGSFGAFAATDGPNASVVNGGLAGSSSSDPQFTTLTGSAGGGGGSGTGTDGGGGGGAGGGVVLIYSVGDFNLGSSTDSTIGYIKANGGKGGDGSSTAGPGGGGGGGSILVFTGGGLNIYNTDGFGASEANAGNGGTNSAAASGASGSLGRSWFAGVNYGGSGSYSPPEDFSVSATTVEFDSTTQFVVTNVFDTGVHTDAVTRMFLQPSSSDFLFEVAGSSDNFALDDTGWTTDLSLIKNKRYLKMKLGVTTSTPTSPAMIDTATISYQPDALDEFNFKAAGCGRIEKTNSPWSSFALLILPLFFLLAVRRLKLKT